MSGKEPLTGAHMSISGGVDQALLRGHAAGCRTIQIFTKNSNQWAGRKLDPGEIERFRANIEKTGIDPVVAHDSYLINLASPNDVLRRKSQKSFLDEMERCRFLGIRHLIMHPGSHTGSGEKEGLKTISAELNAVLEVTDGWNVDIVLEITAGQGTNLGYRFEHLAEIIDNIGRKERMKVCFDTCHAYAAGYNIAGEDGYRRTMDEFDRILGLDRLVAFHINDSKRELGSRVDRHEHLGRGMLGETVFRLIMNDERFRNIPKIIETPKKKGLVEDMMNLAFLAELTRFHKPAPNFGGNCRQA